MTSQGSSLFLNTDDGLADAARRSICMPAARPIRCPRSACGCAASRSTTSPCWAACSTTTRPAARSTTTARCAAPRNRAATSTPTPARCSSPRCSTRSTSPRNGDMVDGRRSAPGLPGTYKLGAWYDTGAFPDQRFDTTGLSLADPASTGIAAHAAAQLQHLRRGRPDGLAARSDEAARRRRVRPHDGRAGRPQPGQLQRQCRRDAEGAVRRAATTTRSASATASPRSAAARPASTRTPSLFTGAVSPVARQRELHRGDLPGPGRRPGGRCSRTSNTSSCPAAASPNPNNPTQRIGNEAVFGLRTNIMF